jgi:hypothetical protein
MACNPQCQCDVYCLGLVACNEEIVLPFAVNQSGVHTMRVEFNGQVYYQTATFDEDDTTMTFPNVWNECADISFKIIQPDLTEYSYTANEVDYTCFEIQIRPFIDLTPTD